MIYLLVDLDLQLKGTFPVVLAYLTRKSSGWYGQQCVKEISLKIRSIGTGEDANRGTGLYVVNVNPDLRALRSFRIDTLMMQYIICRELHLPWLIFYTRVKSSIQRTDLHTAIQPVTYGSAEMILQSHYYRKDAELNWQSSRQSHCPISSWTTWIS